MRGKGQPSKHSPFNTNRLSKRQWRKPYTPTTFVGEDSGDGASSEEEKSRSRRAQGTKARARMGIHPLLRPEIADRQVRSAPWRGAVVAQDLDPVVKLLEPIVDPAEDAPQPPQVKAEVLGSTLHCHSHEEQANATDEGQTVGAAQPTKHAASPTPQNRLT